MRPRNRILALIGISLDILIIALFAVFPPDEESRYVYAYEDSYVCEGWPTDNYGENISFNIGNVNGGQNKVYFKFYVSDFPDNSLDAELSIELFYLNGPLRIEIYELEGSWDEGSVTWNTRPSDYYYIDSFEVLEAKQYRIDIKSFIQGVDDTQEEIDIGLSADTGYSSNFVIGWTTNVCSNCDGTPCIIFEEAAFPWFILVTFISVVGISTASLVIVWKRKKERGVGSKDDVSLRSYEHEPLVGGRYESIKKKGAEASAAAQEKICLFCGLRNKSRTGYCKGCGNPLPS